MQIFTLVWLGQLVSLMGSSLTEFALGVWVYQHTGSVTQLALSYLFAYLPQIALSPLAGALIDRWDRRSCMIISDAGAAFGSFALTILLFADRLMIWQIWLILGISSFFKAFYLPAYDATIALLVPKKQLNRANGMVQISKATARIISPMIGGILLVTTQLSNVLLIDCMTFLFSLVILLLVRFPRLRSSHIHQGKGMRSLLHEASYGWTYIARYPGLLGLLMVLTVTYFTFGIVEVLFTPLILNFASSKELGLILTTGGCGWLVGSVAISAWKRPLRQVYGVFTFVIIQGLLLFLGVLQPSVLLTGLGIFGYLMSYPIIITCNQAIWQCKVAPEIQGRVFATRLAIEWSSFPLAYTLAGPLADKVFQPLLAPNGLLAASVGRFIGVGAGRGIALLFILMGMFNILAAVLGYLYPRSRLVEDELPDVI